MKPSRRKFLRDAAAGGILSSFLPLLPTTTTLLGNRQATKRSLRVIHLTDVHILDQRNAEASFARVISDINSMTDKPDFILNTGDTVMDENKQSKDTVTRRWTIWNKMISANKVPIYSALGNHDVWYGADEKLDLEYRRDPRYGKRWAMEELSMPERYYSFHKGGWHFIALDSINGNEGYQLDDLQFEWLAGELQKITSETPVCVFNHVPIISIGAMLYLTKRARPMETKFPSGDMHLDHNRIKDLFMKHKNVKLCLSGHVHYIDAIEYLGVKYLCNGAVSGNWWRDPIVLDEFPPVYSIIDLFEDGSSTCENVYYRFQA